MKGDKEIVGTLRGFDDYVNILFLILLYLSNYCNLNQFKYGSWWCYWNVFNRNIIFRNITPTGKQIVRQKNILLNGSQVCMVF